jgi:Peptidase inhibitor I78 family
VGKALTRKYLAVALALGLGACVATDEPVAGACGAKAMQELVGQNKAIFAAMTVPMGTRIIEPGMPITEDYSASRLNFDLDEAGTITRVWCG